MNTNEIIMHYEMLDSIVNDFVESLRQKYIGSICLVWIPDEEYYEEEFVKDFYVTKTITGQSEIIVKLQNTASRYLRDVELMDDFEDM